MGKPEAPVLRGFESVRKGVGVSQMGVSWKVELKVSSESRVMVFKNLNIFKLLRFLS